MSVLFTNNARAETAECTVNEKFSILHEAAETFVVAR